MSDREMPGGGRAELLLAARNVDLAARDSLATVLRFVARVPWETGRALDWGMTLEGIPFGGMTGAALVRPALGGERLDALRGGIRILRALPLHAAERRMAERLGVPELLRAMGERGADAWDLDRPPSTGPVNASRSRLYCGVLPKERR
jgi:hypothetical protein